MGGKIGFSGIQWPQNVAHVNVHLLKPAAIEGVQKSTSEVTKLLSR